MAGDLIDWLSINCAALKSVKNQGICLFVFEKMYFVIWD